MPSPEVRRRVLQDSEAHFRARYEPGVYKDGPTINEMIQYHFTYFSTRLDHTLIKVVSRDFMDLLLYMYDLSSSIQNNVDHSSQSERERWQECGPCLRRSLKYLAERVCLLSPKKTPNLSKVTYTRIEEALLCADMMVRISITSEKTYGLFPNHSIATVYPPDDDEFFRVDVDSLYPDYERKALDRMLLDTTRRERVLNGPCFDLDSAAIEETLNPAFASSFGLSFYDFISILKSVIEGCEPQKGAFPIPFVPVSTLVEQLASQGVSEETCRRILAGFSISPAKLQSDGRVIWKPQQQSRAYRRAFFEFPHRRGAHLCFSKAMALESLVHLVRETSFQKLPSEWRTKETNAALDVLSNQAGTWFERKVRDQFTHFGVEGERVKNNLGTGTRKLPIPAECGEIDFLGYSKKDKLLVIAELKMVNVALEPKFLRDDLTAFVTQKNSYAHKFRKKVLWVVNNHSLVEKALDIPKKEARGLAPVMITLYPTIASIFIDDFPCVTVTEFICSYSGSTGWPYKCGLHYW